MSTSQSLWLDGPRLRFVDQDGNEWSYEGERFTVWRNRDGELVDERVETLWIEGSEFHYVDEDGVERVPETTVVGQTDGIEGSIWIEGSRLTFVDGDGQKVRVENPDPDGGSSAVDIHVEELDVEPTTVAAGESVELSVTYTNVGDGGQDVERIYVGDRLAVENEFEIEAGESGTVSGSVSTEPEDAGSTELRFELPNSGESETIDLTVLEESSSEANVAVDQLTVERDYTTVGETIEYSGAYTNYGDDGQVTSRLYLGDVLVDELEFPMDAGETHDGADTVEITEEHVGAEELRLEFVDSGAAASEELTVVGNETDVDPWLFSIEPEQSEVKAGESFEATIEATNIGGDGPALTRVWVGDRIEHEHYGELSDGESIESNPEIQTVYEDVGAEEVRAEFALAGATASADLHVWDACSERDAEGLLIDEFETPDDLQVGDSGSIDVSFTNCGEDGAVVSPSISLDDEQLWSTLDVVDHRDRLTESVQLAPQAGEWGEVTVRADSGDEVREATLEIDPLPFDVEIAGTPAVTGTDVSVTADVSNGSFDGTDRQPVELLLDGEVVDETEVELERLESTSVELSGPISPGEHTVTVATATDEASTPIDVPEPTGDVSVKVGEVRDPVLHSREVLEVPATVVNESDDETTVDVRVRSDVAVATELVDLAGGESREVTLAVDVDPDPDAGLELEVRALSEATGEELATATTSVSVIEPLELTFGEYEPAPAGEDGMYRDFTGDGTVGQTDVVGFFEYQHREAVQDRPEYFDFSGNGNVGHGDVVTLFEDVVVGGY